MEVTRTKAEPEEILVLLDYIYVIGNYGEINGCGKQEKVVGSGCARFSPRGGFTASDKS